MSCGTESPAGRTRQTVTSEHPEYPDVDAPPAVTGNAVQLAPPSLVTAGAIIAPVAVVIDDGGPGFGSIFDTFNQSGLTLGYTSGVTDFDTYLAAVPRHTMLFGGFEWFSNFGTTGATVTYDLGVEVAIDRLALWNEESSGIGTLDLFGSKDGAVFAPLASNLHPTDNPVTIPADNPPYAADVFAFPAASVRFVRFVISDSPQPNPGSFPSAAIGEVAFRVGSQPPVALCQDVTVEADGTCRADASIDAGSFDPDGDAITCVQDPTGPYGVGTTTVTLTCTDTSGLSSSCTGNVTVLDVTPPVVVQGPPTVLWPPNHKYVAFSLASCIEAIADDCSGPLPISAAQITHVTSDEPDDAGGGGDGNTSNDMVITGPTTADLRAERQGGGDGRVYEVHFTVQDPSGNVARGVCPVEVPHSNNGTAAVDSGDAHCVGAGC